jgi:hypothetical protein
LLFLWARPLGVVPGMFGTCIVSWAISWAIAFPTMVIMMPIVRRWLLRVIEEKQKV